MEDLYEVIKNYGRDNEEIVFTGSWLDCKNKADVLQEKANKSKTGDIFAVYFAEGNYGEVGYD